MAQPQFKVHFKIIIKLEMIIRFFICSIHWSRILDIDYQ